MQRMVPFAENEGVLFTKTLHWAPKCTKTYSDLEPNWLTLITKPLCKAMRVMGGPLSRLAPWHEQAPP